MECNWLWEMSACGHLIAELGVNPVKMVVVLFTRMYKSQPFRSELKLKEDEHFLGLNVDRIAVLEIEHH